MTAALTPAREHSATTRATSAAGNHDHREVDLLFYRGNVWICAVPEDLLSIEANREYLALVWAVEQVPHKCGSHTPHAIGCTDHRDRLGIENGVEPTPGAC